MTQTIAGGYTGKILRVDLSSTKTSVQELDKVMARDYVGGEGFATRIIAYELPSGVAPLCPEALVAVMTGPLTGTPLPGASSIVIASKSPATGFTLTVSRSQGFFASQLKAAGYDGIVIKGRAEKPVYLKVFEGAVEIKDARAIWNKDTYETEDVIKEELGDSGAKVACIGPAGENKVLISAIVVEKHHAAARGGLAAVWGSKNLKAIAVRGNKRVPIADEERFEHVNRQWRDYLKSQPARYDRGKYGTAGNVLGAYMMGDLPIKNFSRGILEDYEKLSGQYMRDSGMVVRDLTCFSCPVAHDKLIKINEGPFAGKTFIQPEYEHVGGLGSDIGVTDTGAVAYLTDVCNRLGLDIIAAGNTVAFAMECFERGILSAEDVEGLDLRWGNYTAVAELLGKIARREGLGKILAMDVGRASESIGKGADKYAVHVKGMSIIMHDFRAFWSYALQYAVGSAGPVHEGGGDTIGAYFRGERRQTAVEGLGEILREAQAARTFMNTCGTCEFSSPTGLVILPEAVTIVTGHEISRQDARTTGLRIINLRRLFSVKNGLTPEDDTLPPRLLEESTEGGAKGLRVPIKTLVRDYYEAMGWDEKTGKPYLQTLRELNLRDWENIWDGTPGQAANLRLSAP
jgi:aldehyde:ferredoxin oxidoreductase